MLGKVVRDPSVRPILHIVVFLFQSVSQSDHLIPAARL